MIGTSVQEQSANVVPAGQKDRRASERCFSDRKPTIRLLLRPNFEELTATIHDASTSGVGLIVSRSIASGTVFLVQLNRKSDHRISSILSAQVVHCTPLTPATWLIGCKLSTRLRSDELKILLEAQSVPVQRAEPAQDKEKQAWVRYDRNPTSPMIGATQHDNSRHAVRLRDITRDGLTVCSNRHLKVGDYLAIDFDNANHSQVQVPIVRIASASSHTGDGWVIRCEFPEKLTDEQLHDLLS